MTDFPLFVKNILDIRKDLIHVLCPVDRNKHASSGIVVDQRLGLCVIDVQSCFDRLRLVIVSQDEGLSADVTDILDLGRIENDVICRTAADTCASSGHAVNNIVIRDIDIHRIVDLLSELFNCSVKCLRLRDRPRESIQKISVLAVVLLNTIYYEVAYELIRYELPGGRCLPWKYAELNMLLQVSLPVFPCRLPALRA